MDHPRPSSYVPVVIDTNTDEGPAVTSIEYKIDPKSAEEFLEAMKEMKRIRLRDSADPERYLEIFVTESWGEHLRQHERITAEDRKQKSGPWPFTLALDHRGSLTSSQKNCQSD